MRFMTLVKSAERLGAPPQEFLDAVAKAAEAATRDGTLILTGGLGPSATSARIRVSNGKVTVTDGPFTEAKEVVGGFGVVEAKSLKEALEGVTALMELHRKYWPAWEGEAEVRPMFERAAAHEAYAARVPARA